MEQAGRGFRKGHGLGIRGHILEQLMTVNVTTPSGIVMGETQAIPIPLERVKNFASNIAKGLHSQITGHLFDWSQYEIRCSVNQAMQTLGPLEDRFMRRVWDEGPYGERWEGIFSYKGAISEDEKASTWIMTLYSSHIIAVTLIEKEALKEAKNLQKAL